MRARWSIPSVAFVSVLALSGCAAPVAGDEAELEEGEALAEDADVGAVSQALVGQGETFWMPPPGEIAMNIPYCYEDLPSMTQRRSLTRSALAATWEQSSRVRFTDNGSCSSTLNALRAVRIRGWNVAGGLVGFPPNDYRFGTRLAGVVDGMKLPLDSVSSSSVGFQITSAHEFGHALGFWHEHTREDFSLFRDCGNPVFWGQYNPNEPRANTTVTTPWDPNSIMEAGYCLNTNTLALSASDKAGVAAIYGAPNAYVMLGDSRMGVAIRFQRNGRWLQPTDTAAANTQYFIGSWERVLIFREGGPHADNILRYGDVVGVVDRFGRWLSGRDNPASEINMQPHRQEWERWRVETMNESRYPTGSRVLVNAPVRLRNLQFNGWLGSTTGGDVHLSTSGDRSDLRINGPLSVF